MSDIALVYSTFADVESAKRVSKELVLRKLCACANIIPKIISIYEWQGELCESDEVAVIFKTTKDKSSSFQSELKKLHPYELPAIITLHADASAQFSDWVISKTI